MKKEKNSSQNNSPEKKKNKKLLIIIPIAILILLILSIVFFLLFKNVFNKEKDYEYTTLEGINYVGQIENDTYYIPSASEYIAFPVEKQKQDSYEVVNEDNEKVKTKILKIDDHYYIVSKNAYKKGQEYTLTIKDNTILDDRLPNAKKVIFKIEKDEVETYKYSDRVKEIDSSKIKLNNNQLDVSSLNLKEGNIVLVKHDDTVVDAYKIDKIANDLATTSTVNLAEIYDELEIYKNIKPDFSTMTLYDEDGNEVTLTNGEVKKYLAEPLVNKVVNEMPVYQTLVNEAKKTENEISNSVDFKEKDGNLIFEININVKANGKKFMGISALREHDLTMTLTFEIGLDILADTTKGHNINLAATLTETLNVDISLTNSIYHEGFSGLDDSEYDKTVQDIISRLEGKKRDSASGRATIGALEIPTNIPGLNVYFDLYFQTDTNLILNATYHQGITESQTVGIATIDGELTPYFNDSSPELSLNFNVFGSANTTLGIGLDIGLSIINKNIANVNIGEELGFYADMFTTANVDYNSEVSQTIVDTYVGGKIDLGVYLKVKMNSNINVLFLKQSKTVNFIDAKKSLFKAGSDEITTGIEPTTTLIDLGKNKSVNMPNVYKKVLNVSSEEITKEKIDTSLLKYTNAAGEDLTKTAIDFKDKNEFIVYITYEENNHKYQTQVKLVKDDDTDLSDIVIDMTPKDEPEENKDDNSEESSKEEPVTPEKKMVKVSKEEAMKICQENFEFEKNGVKVYCQYSNIVRAYEDENAPLDHAIYVLASDDPWTNGLTAFVSPSCKYGYYYTTVFIPTEYEEGTDLRILTGWWFEDYTEVDYIGTVTFPFVMN